MRRALVVLLALMSGWYLGSHAEEASTVQETTTDYSGKIFTEKERERECNGENTNQ